MKRYKIEMEGLETDIGSAAELVTVFDALSGQNDRLVIEKLGADLPDIIVSGSGLYQVLKSLAPENMMFLLETMGVKTGTLFSAAGELAVILAFLSVPQTEDLLLKLIGREKLRAMLASPAELAEVLEWVYEDTDLAVLQMLGAGHLSALFRSGTELGLVLNSLDETGQQQLLDMIGWAKTAEITYSWQDLAHLLRALPASLSAGYLTGFKPEILKKLLANKSDWRKVKRFLEPEEEALLKKIAGVDYAE